MAHSAYYHLIIHIGSHCGNKFFCVVSFYLFIILNLVRTSILGISAFYHDSAAAIIIDGEIKAAAQEERFTRLKHDPTFPVCSIKYVLEETGISYDDLTAVVFYDKPFLKFERLLETFHAFSPKGLKSFIAAIPVWIREKLFMRKLIRDKLKEFGEAKVPIFFSEHHLSHAASAFYPSPYDESAILTIDGVGEWATTTICHGGPNGIKIVKELHFPHSVGLLYAAFTYFLGFKVNSGEYKLMGLVPYGNPASVQVREFKDKILTELVDVREDGSLLLNMKYFDFATDVTMTNDQRWLSLFGIARRKPESEIHQEHMNLALAIQEVTEFIVLKLAQTAKDLTRCKNLVMAGGVALNCVCNSKIADAGIFDNIWIQPAAGDAGGALGAALAVAHTVYKQERKVQADRDAMMNSYLGPQYWDGDILRVINKFQAPYQHFPEFNEMSSFISRQIADGKIVGWFQGRMEFGPRALGNRSIVGDPRNPGMQKFLNLKIKSREEFRPFAPSILEEDLSEYFTPGISSPYMLFTRSLRKEFRTEEPHNYAQSLLDRLYHVRSIIPAVTHIDYSSRVQTVSKSGNPKFWQLINDFKKISGIGILINTSFNVRGEPMVCTPHDAYIDFMRTEMDFLVIGNYVFDKRVQAPLASVHLEAIRYASD